MRLKDRHEIWRRIREFLTAFTTCDEPGNVRLLLAEGAHVDPAFFSKAHDQATREFGVGERRLAVAGALTEHEHKWPLRHDQIDDALALMDRVEIPEHLGRSLLVVAITYDFLLRDPETGETLPNQGADRYGRQEADSNLFLGRSTIYLRLGSRSTCALFLSLPFVDLGPDALSFIASVEDALPFRLSPKHWARWQLNASGTRYYKRRLELDAIG